MLQLAAQKREAVRKRLRALRRQGVIPAELYGRGRNNAHLGIPQKDFLKVFREAGENTVVQLRAEMDSGTEQVNVLIHDVQTDSITDEVLHIDFYEVRMDEKITVTVPLRFTGEAPGVKEHGGVLVRAAHELEVEALPADLPHEITVDLQSLLDIGASIHVKDLEIEKRVRALVDPETVVATVVVHVEEEVPQGPASVEEVKVESEEKRAEVKAKEEETAA